MPRPRRSCGQRVEAQQLGGLLTTSVGIKIEAYSSHWYKGDDWNPIDVEWKCKIIEHPTTISELGIGAPIILCEPCEPDPVFKPTSDSPVVGYLRCRRLGADEKHEHHSNRDFTGEAHTREAA